VKAVRALGKAKNSMKKPKAPKLDVKKAFEALSLMDPVIGDLNIVLKGDLVTLIQKSTLTQALKKVHHLMDKDIENRGKKTVNFTKVSDETRTVAWGATMKIFPRTLTMKKDLDEVSNLLDDLLEKMHEMRIQIGSSLIAQLTEPAMFTCPGEHFGIALELIIAFAGILASLKTKSLRSKGAEVTARTMNRKVSLYITDEQYKDYLELDELHKRIEDAAFDADDEDEAAVAELTDDQKKTKSAIAMKAKKFQAMVMNLSALQGGMDTVKEVLQERHGDPSALNRLDSVNNPHDSAGSQKAHSASIKAGNKPSNLGNRASNLGNSHVSNKIRGALNDVIKAGTADQPTDVELVKAPYGKWDRLSVVNSFMSAVKEEEEKRWRKEEKKPTHLLDFKMTREEIQGILELMGVSVTLQEADGFLLEAIATQSQFSVQTALAMGSSARQEAQTLLRRFQESIAQSGAISINLLHLVSFGERFRSRILRSQPSSKQGKDVFGALKLVENVYQLFADDHDVVTKSTLDGVRDNLGEVGLAIFNEVFPLHDLHETVPKNVFYQQMLMFSEGEVPGTELSQGLTDFQVLGNMVIQMKRNEIASGDTRKEEEVGDEVAIQGPSEKKLPEGYLEQLVRLGTFCHIVNSLLGSTVGWYVLTMRPIRWRVVEAWVTPYEFTVRRSAESFEYAFGDLESEWALNNENTCRFVKNLLGYDSFASRKEAALLWEVAFDPQRRRQITWRDVATVIQRRQDFNNKCAELLNRKVFDREHYRLLPNTWVTTLRSRVMIIVSLYIFIVSPCQLAFKSLAWMEDQWQVEVIVSSMLFFNAASQLITAYSDSNGLLVMDYLMIRERYLKLGGLAELLAVPPLGLMGYYLSGSEPNPYIVNLLGLNHMLLVIQQLKANQQLIIHQIMSSNMLLLVVMMCGIHILSCGWFLLGNSVSDGWYRQLILDIPGEVAKAAEEGHNVSFTYAAHIDDGLVKKYLLSFYYVFNILMTHGMTSVIPTTYMETAYTMFILLMSLTVMAYVGAYISMNMMHHEDVLMKQRRDDENLSNFVKKAGLPDPLRHEIENFYRNESNSDSVNTQELYDGMSFYLKVRVSKELYRDTLDSVALFYGCTNSFLDGLTVLLHEKFVAPSQTIFNQNDPPKEMYILRGGCVVVKTIVNITDPETGDNTHEEGEMILKVTDTGGVIGQLSFFFQIQHINSAATAADSVANLLSLEQMAFRSHIMNYKPDENTIAENCLSTYEITRKAHSNYARSVMSDGKKKDPAASEAQSLGGTEATHVENRMSSIDDKTKVLRRKHFSTLMVQLLTAVQSGTVHDINMVLKRSLIHVNSHDSNKRTPISVAASEGRLEIVQFLVLKGAQLNEVDHMGNTPLYDAVRNKHEDVVDALLKAGAVLGLDENTVGVLMCEAASKEDQTVGVQEIRLLVKCGSNVNSKDYDGRTALHLAASTDKDNVIKVLLSLGADMYAKDRFDGTPLDDALRERNQRAMTLLVEAGATINEMKASLQLCQAGCDGDLDFIQHMMNNGSNLSAGDYDRRTCLHLAASSGQVHVVNYLLSHQDIDVNVVDRMGGTPLDDAYRHQHKVIIAMLQDSGGLRGNHPVMLAKAEKVERLVAQAEKDKIERDVDLMVEASDETAMLRELNPIKLKLLESLNLLRISNEKVRSRIASWRDPARSSGSPACDAIGQELGPFPMLQLLTVVLREAAHISFCCRQADKIKDLISVELKPMLANKHISKVLKDADVTEVLPGLIFEVDLYKNSLSALESLKIFADKAHKTRRSIVCVLPSPRPKPINQGGRRGSHGHTERTWEMAVNENMALMDSPLETPRPPVQAKGYEMQNGFIPRRNELNSVQATPLSAFLTPSAITLRQTVTPPTIDPSSTPKFNLDPILKDESSFRSASTRDMPSTRFSVDFYSPLTSDGNSNSGIAAQQIKEEHETPLPGQLSTLSADQDRELPGQIPSRVPRESRRETRVDEDILGVGSVSNRGNHGGDSSRPTTPNYTLANGETIPANGRINPLLQPVMSGKPPLHNVPSLDWNRTANFGVVNPLIRNSNNSRPSSRGSANGNSVQNNYNSQPSSRGSTNGNSDKAPMDLSSLVARLSMGSRGSDQAGIRSKNNRVSPNVEGGEKYTGDLEEFKPPSRSS